MQRTRNAKKTEKSDLLGSRPLAQHISYREPSHASVRPYRRDMPLFVRDGATVKSASRHRGPDSVSLRVDEEGIWFDGALAIPRHEISSVTIGLAERTI